MAAPPGNQFAKKAKLYEQAIKRALARASGESVDAGLDKGADKLVAAFHAGEPWAIKEVGDRLDGKPATVIVGGDDDDNPVRIEAIAIKLVQPKADGT